MGDIEKVEKIINEEYYYLLQIGLVYASWRDKWAFISAFQYCFYYIILCLFTLDFFYTAYLCLGDITLFSQSLHFGIACVVSWTVSINCTLFRKNVFAIYSSFIYGLCNYENGEFYEGAKYKLQREKATLLIFWPLYYGFCVAFGFILGPMIDNYLGIDAGLPPHPQISLKLPVSFWIPFNVEDNIIIYMAMCILVAIMGFIAALIVSAGVVACIVLMLNLCLHLELLINSLETIDLRTKQLYSLKEGPLSLKNFNNKLYFKYYYQCLIENIRHHQEILRVYRKFEKLVEIPIAVPFLAGAILLAMAGIHILSDDPRVGPKFLSGSLAFGEMLNMLMLCAYGERLKKMNEDLRMAVYSIKWYEADRQCQTAVSILQKRTLKPMNIKCLYILEINMETFATIINSAYSYFNLVIAFK